LPLPEIARLYARRWDIELAFLTLKRELGLHLIWSSKSVVVLAQVWACLIIAQVLQAIRMEVALRAEVDAFEVSLPLLIEAFPQFGSQGRDGITECVLQGRRLGIIRPSTRLRIQASEIPRELLIPLPKDATLGRQPHYQHGNRPNRPITSDQENHSDTLIHPEIEVHPQRDRIVEILLQREARLKAATQQTKARPPAKSKATSITSKTKTMKVPAGKVTVRPLSPVQPDPCIVLPLWSFLQPLFASA
jgi:Transposase DDE domain